MTAERELRRFEHEAIVDVHADLEDFARIVGGTVPDEDVRPASDALGRTSNDATRWFESAADLLAEPDPGPTPMLVDDLIVEAAVAALVGPPKARKTWTLLELAVAIASGRAAFGRFLIPIPGPVLIIVEESGRAALHRRLDMLTRGRAIDPELLREFYFAANRRVRLDQPEWRERLLEAAAEKPWRLIAFDPFVRVKGHINENDQHEVGPVLDFLRELRDVCGGTVAYNHHTPHDGTRQRGSSDLEAYWETKLTLRVDGEKRTLEAEHREAEAAGPYELSFRFHAETRTLRIDADEDELHRAVREYDETHPEAPANEIHDVLKEQGLGARKERILEVVRRVRERRFPVVSETGTAPISEAVPDPGTARNCPTADTGSRGRWRGTQKGFPSTTGRTSAGTSSRPSENGSPVIGDDGYLEHLFGALQAGLITEDEWHQGDRAHRLVKRTVIVVDDTEHEGTA